MNTYTPDKWVILKIITPEGETIYKVFATWAGGYFDSDYWRVNSSIVETTFDEDYYYFKGYTGSTYECPKSMYGVCGGSNYSTLNRFLAEEGVSMLEWDEFLEWVE